MIKLPNEDPMTVQKMLDKYNLNSDNYDLRNEKEQINYKTYLKKFFRSVAQDYDYIFNSKAKLELIDLFNVLLGLPKGIFKYDLANDEIVFDKNNKEFEGFQYDPYFTPKSTFCGRLFEKGEVVYKCRDCGIEPTCALCSACFNATNHEGHEIGMLVHNNRDGCCGCGDLEVWKELNCKFHSPIHDRTKQQIDEFISDVTQFKIELFISQTLTIFIKVMQNSLVPNIHTFKDLDVKNDAINFTYGIEGLDSKEISNLYSLVVWDDDEHTFAEFERLCQSTIKCNKFRAVELRKELDRFGRAIVETSESLEDILKVTEIFQNTAFVCTVRSAYPIFMEQLTGFMIHYIYLLTNSEAITSHMGQEFNMFLLKIFAKNLCVPLAIKKHNIAFPDLEWMQQPPNPNPAPTVPSGFGSYREWELRQPFRDYLNEDGVPILSLGRAGRDHARRIRQRKMELDTGPVRPPPDPTHDQPTYLENPIRFIGPVPDITLATETPFSYTKEFPVEVDVAYPYQVPPTGVEKFKFDFLLTLDKHYWNKLRYELRQLYMISPMMCDQELRLQTGKHFIVNYPQFLINNSPTDLGYEQGLLGFSVQILLLPSVAVHLIQEMNLLNYLITLVSKFFLPPAPNELNAATRYSTSYSNPLIFCDPFSFHITSGELKNNDFQNKLCSLVLQDLHLILQHEEVQRILPHNHLHVSNFLHFLTYFQGTNPNRRQADTHVEFEPDSYILAFEASFYLYRLMLPFTKAFSTSTLHLAKAIRRTMYKIDFWISRGGEASINDAMGGTYCVKFDKKTDSNKNSIDIVQFSVEDGAPVSFHYTLHWFLSLLLLHVRILDQQSLNALGYKSLTHLLVGCDTNSKHYEDNCKRVLAIFDFPLRAIVKSAQIRANLWVRNGYVIRTQNSNYRELPDSIFNLDLYLVQCTFAILPPDTLILTLLDRFSLMCLVSQNLTHLIYDKVQLFEIIGEFFSLFLYCLTERGKISGQAVETELRREVLHLTITPLTFTELDREIPDRLAEFCNSHNHLQDVCTFKPCESITDSGKYQLKEELLPEVNPYFFISNRNSRDMAEQAKKQHAKAGEPYFLPHLEYIEEGPFVNFGDIVHQEAMMEVIFHTLYHCVYSDGAHIFLDDVLQIYLIAAVDKNSCHVLSDQVDPIDTDIKSIWSLTSTRKFTVVLPPSTTPVTLSALHLLTTIANNSKFEASQPKLVYVLSILEKYGTNEHRELIGLCRSGILNNQQAEEKAREREKRRARAMARNAKIMKEFTTAQNKFMESQVELYNETNIVSGDLESFAMEMDEVSSPEKPYLTGSCLICQEEATQSNLCGVLAFIQPSKLLSTLTFSDINMSETIKLQGRGVKLQKHPVLPTEKQRLRNFADSEASPQHPPASKHTLYGSHVSSCGHLLHLSCLEEHYTQLETRLNCNPARNYLENLNYREFLCPLCKSLSNVLLPIHKNPGLAHRLAEEEMISFSDWKDKFDWAIFTIEEMLIEPQIKHAAEKLKLDPDDLVHPYTNRFRTTSIPIQTLSPFQGDIMLGTSEPLSLTGSALPFTALQTRRRNQVLTASRAGTLINDFMDNLIKTSPRQTGNPLQNEQIVTFFKHPPPMFHPNLSSFFEHEKLVLYYHQLIDIYRINYAQRVKHQPFSVKWREYAPNFNLLDPVLYSLAYTITMVEITDRSTEVASSEANSKLLNPSFLINRIPTITRDMLVILWNNVLGIALNGGLGFETYYLKRTFITFQWLQGGPDSRILLCDPFQLLVEMAVVAVPLLKLDIRHLVRYLLIAQLVKVVTGCFQAKFHPGFEAPTQDTYPIDEYLQQFMRKVAKHAFKLDESAFNQVWNIGLRYCGRFIYDTMLVFVRKSVIFLDISQTPLNRTFQTTNDPMDDLLASLSLPKFQAIVRESVQDVDMMEICFKWLSSFQVHSNEDHSLAIEFPYAYSLTALPENLGELFTACRYIKCVSCKKFPTNPGICLQCGTVVCVQSDCCRSVGSNSNFTNGEEEGEANLHRRYCSGLIAGYLVIHSCSTVLLHNSNGSYFPAPYLDIHDESDLELRKGRPLKLNKLRYNRLLKLFLTHQIPQTICRRLEPNYDFGGWQTL